MLIAGCERDSTCFFSFGQTVKAQLPRNHELCIREGNPRRGNFGLRGSGKARMSLSDPVDRVWIALPAGSAEVFGLVSQLAQIGAGGKLKHDELLS